MNTVTAWLGLGSNLGDRLANLREALRRLSCGDVTIARISSVYESRAILMEEQPDFLNLAVEIRTELSPAELLSKCLMVEQDMGRMRLERWGPRSIDIDILLYGCISVNESSLCIPHPGVTSRGFVIIPLLEIQPDLKLPSGEHLNSFVTSEMRDGLKRVAGPPIIP